MELLPAIDLRGGRVVRLLRGDDARRTAYSDRPVEVLEGFARAGARWVHAVDLDAAFGEPPQLRTVEALARAAEDAGIRLQIGGGIRDDAAVEGALAAGCERVVVGSLVARDFPAFAELAGRWKGRLVPALDVAPDPLPNPPSESAAGEGRSPARGYGVLDGRVRIAGWREDAGTSLEELCAGLRELPCPAVLVTDVSRDGALEGPNLLLARAVAEAAGLPALLSGGVATLEDLVRAAATPGIVGAVVGRALYEGRFGLEEALAACRAVDAGAAEPAGEVET